ncbi:Similar to PLB1: Phospholipase B1, partial [Cotesia congregata]
MLSLSLSPIPPDSVHKLRPGDIDVIGGLGDSLVAASGALEEFAIGTFIEARGAKLNVAFPVAATEDALHQAKILIKRIKSNSKIDIKKHWKLVTIFFGANDI